PEHGNWSPESVNGATARMLLIVDDPDAMVARAIAAGGRQVHPVIEAHGWRMGRIEDPFGHHWEIGRPLVPWPPAGGAHRYRALARGNEAARRGEPARELRRVGRRAPAANPAGGRGRTRRVRPDPVRKRNRGVVRERRLPVPRPYARRLARDAARPER